MILFEPETPWGVGQHVTLRNEDTGESCTKVVESVQSSTHGDHTETQYALVDPKVWGLRLQGVRPFAELG